MVLSITMTPSVDSSLWACCRYLECCLINNNRRVVILDQNGSWLLTINGNVSGSHGFKAPYGLALDPQRNIHVTAWVLMDYMYDSIV